MVNFKKNIADKADQLIRKAKVLPYIKINWENPIEIKCDELKSIQEIKEKITSTFFDINKSNPAVYYFLIKSNHLGSDLINALSSYKQKKERSCPKIDKKRSVDSKYLYCGSKKKALGERFIQHLGFGSQHTFALQLLHWSKEIKLELEFHYAWLEPENKEFTELIEAALAEKIKPIVGKLV